VKIVGIDLSLTGSGLCEIEMPGLDVDPTTENFGLVTSVVTSAGKTKDTLPMRFDRQTKITAGVLAVAKTADLVVIEYPVSGKHAGHLIDRAGFWWRVVGSCLLWDIEVVSPVPQHAKKFLTGSGSAPKGEMVRVAGKVWPQWTPATIKNVEDEADAIALATIGVALALPVPEWPFSLTQYRTELAKTLAYQHDMQIPEEK
jgi:hypothetical protein